MEPLPRFGKRWISVYRSPLSAFKNNHPGPWITAGSRHDFRRFRPRPQPLKPSEPGKVEPRKGEPEIASPARARQPGLGNPGHPIVDIEPRAGSASGLETAVRGPEAGQPGCQRRASGRGRGSSLRRPWPENISRDFLNSGCHQLSNRNIQPSGEKGRSVSSGLRRRVT